MIGNGISRENMEKKRLDQLDFLRYKLEQRIPEAKTPRQAKAAWKGCGL